MVVKYGPTKGCRGCSWATGRSNHKQSHSDECRKRFIEKSNEPGNEDLKHKVDQAFERVTRKYTETLQKIES